MSRIGNPPTLGNPSAPSLAAHAEFRSATQQITNLRCRDLRFAAAMMPVRSCAPGDDVRSVYFDKSRTKYLKFAFSGSICAAACAMSNASSFRWLTNKKFT